MRCPAPDPNEPERLKALAQYGLSSTAPLPSLDPIVQIAAHAFDAPAAAVNMIGRDEVFFAASTGIGECDMRRDVSFCAHAINQDDVMVIEDARFDDRFHDNPLVTKTGGVRFYAGVPVRHPSGAAIGALCVIDSMPRFSFSDLDRKRLKEMAKLVTDRLELRRIEVASRGDGAGFGHVALQSPNGIVCFDREGTIKAINPAAEHIFGLAEGEAIGSLVEHVLPGWRGGKLAQILVAGDLEGVQLDELDHLVGIRADGTHLPLEVVWSTWRVGAEPNFGAVIRDLALDQGSEQEMQRLQNFDPATGLPNRELVQRLLGETILSHGRAALVAIRVIGIDDVSGSLGQDLGDDAFRQVIARVRACIRPVDVLARTASNELVLMMPGVGDPLRSMDAAKAVIEAVGAPLSLGGNEIRFDANCGIVLHPAHGEQADELLGSAGLALAEARKQGPGKAILFAQALRMQAVARRMFEAELHHAIDRDELELYYQPQIGLADGRLIGAEALIRWNHPERGVLSPAAFLPALEASALAPAVGNWVVNSACRQAAVWRQTICPDFRMSINLFAAQLRADDLRQSLLSAMKQFALPGQAIELEITETTALDAEATFLPLFRALRDEGIKLAFDDFGTGFASLSLLERYPLTHLKIDKSFVQRAFTNARDRVIAETITSLAHQLDLRVIAEGVESETQLGFCRQIGCDEVQGYLIGKPQPAAEFALAHWGTMHWSNAPGTSNAAH